MQRLENQSGFEEMFVEYDSDILDEITDSQILD